MPDKKEPIWQPSNESEVATITPSTPRPRHQLQRNKISPFIKRCNT